MGAYSKIGGIVDEFADFEEIEEDGWLGLAGWRGEEIAMGEGREDFVRQLKPWSVERRDVAPMSGQCVSDWY